MGGEECIRKIAIFMSPFLQAAIIKQLQIIFDDKWNDTVLQAFLEKDQTPNSAVAVLEGVNPLKMDVEINQVIQSFCVTAVVLRQQIPHSVRHLFRHRRFHSAHFVGHFFVIAYGKPVLMAVGCTGL